MYIKSIKIHGFKSFADKMNIELDPTFTGIVGPNGSGKSNIVDAIKWVLGEQSVKALRGSNNMTDVIFAGSSSRQGSNFASVSIVFDNSDRSLNVDYSEVEIKRCVYKTGENEYSINNDKCRLKDITNLLIDSRGGKDSFNIIPQNKIDQILSEKPEERRIIFEDASGVLKYKKRKEESLSKLSKNHENIDRINLIISENSENLNSLSESAKKAMEYKEAKDELSNIEIALIVSDINNFSNDLEFKKNKVVSLEEELSSLEGDSSTDSVEVEKLKMQMIKLDENIRDTSSSIFNINETLLGLTNKKTLLTERNKYDKESDSVKNNLIALKDKEGNTSNSINALKVEVDAFGKKDSELRSKLEEYNKDLKLCNETLSSFKYDLNKKNVKLLDINNRIDILDNNLATMNKIPYAVKQIVGNPTLRGIYDILGNVIDTKNEYVNMLDTALSASANNIIVDDENCAKEAIEYLKRKNAGKATFFPLNVIKPRSIEPELINNVKTMNGYVGVASDLVTFDSKFYNIIMNQLGNIIVCDNISNATYISKKINHKYRIITLDGDIIYTGGVMSGGSTRKSSSYINDKYELDNLNNSITPLKEEIKNLESKITEKSSEIDLLNESINRITYEIISNSEILKNKNNTLEELNRELDSIKTEIDNLSNKSLDKELEIVINDYYKYENEKGVLEKTLENLNREKSDLNNEITSLENTIKKKNARFNSLNNDINELKIDITKININLDNLLSRLSSEYSLGFETAKSEHILEIDENIAREKVNSLRRKIKNLGEVNLGSIDEYERVSKRVEFLTKQRDDLTVAENDLLNIIDEMDNVMKDKFLTSFKNINTEFGRVFKTLFKGGHAHLELTDPDNILESGIEIIAIPPGKTQKPLSLLSGGERTMSAISLLFSIMNLEHVPFVIFDEVESALDEANATIFGEYLSNYKNKTQLLVITHKKKTMEFLDKLYGITMQESGVSKIVSVKLD